jgi:hypothetical protein
MYNIPLFPTKTLSTYVFMRTTTKAGFLVFFSLYNYSSYVPVIFKNVLTSQLFSYISIKDKMKICKLTSRLFNLKLNIFLMQ